jgi:catechol 2,3-dioxygenase-like lactoylglutathione lyase family enzyme
LRLDHIQLGMPRGGEPEARRFFADLLGMTEEEKPEPLRSRGGCWFRSGDCVVHVGVDPDFTPQRKAHPAFLRADLDALSARLTQAGHPVTWDDAAEGRVRCYTADPFGNRIELIRDGDGFSQR